MDSAGKGPDKPFLEKKKRACAESRHRLLGHEKKCVIIWQRSFPLLPLRQNHKQYREQNQHHADGHVERKSLLED